METPGVPWWQVLGGLAAVFGLLIVFLKFLARLPQAGGNARAGLLAVWAVGPRREVQVLRLQDEVHYLYRHDNALVHLRTEPLAVWQANQPHAEPTRVGPLSARLRDMLQGRRLTFLPPSR
jgi:flagellar biogenesis protein FliO